MQVISQNCASARRLNLAHKRRRVVLVSAPGLVQKATASILASCPEVDMVATAPGALSATALVAETHPDLLLIDATLAEEEMGALLGWVKSNLPGIECVVMAVTSRQRQRFLEWGADVAVYRADFATQLRDVLNCAAAPNGAM
jgi:DNA-binding NarL/FixJ family response regulator